MSNRIIVRVKVLPATSVRGQRVQVMSPKDLSSPIKATAGWRHDLPHGVVPQANALLEAYGYRILDELEQGGAWSFDDKKTRYYLAVQA